MACKNKPWRLDGLISLKYIYGYTHMPNANSKYQFPLQRLLPVHIYLELVFFSIAMMLLFFMKVSINGVEDFSFCPFRWLGFTHCLGCGVGHAIHYALHGQWALSYNAHMFGVPALLIITHRIFFNLITIIQHERKFVQQNSIGRAR